MHFSAVLWALTGNCVSSSSIALRDANSSLKARWSHHTTWQPAPAPDLDEELCARSALGGLNARSRSTGLVGGRDLSLLEGARTGGTAALGCALIASRAGALHSPGLRGSGKAGRGAGREFCIRPAPRLSCLAILLDRGRGSDSAAGSGSLVTTSL